MNCEQVRGHIIYKKDLIQNILKKGERFKERNPMLNFEIG